MTPFFRSFAALSACLLCVPAALAAAPPAHVRDEAGLFRPEVEERAERELSLLAEREQTLVRVVTVASPPAELLSRRRGFFFRSEARALARWAEEQARGAGAHVYILLSKEPARAWVVVHPETPDDRFTDRDRRRLAKSLVGLVEKQQYDEALRQAASGVASRIEENRLQRERGAAVWMPVFWVAAGMLGSWALLGLARTRLRRGVAEPRPGTSLLDQPDNGPLTGLLGGTFGSVLGQYLYETWLARPVRRPAPPPVIFEESVAAPGAATAEPEPAADRAEGTSAEEAIQEGPVHR